MDDEKKKAVVRLLKNATTEAAEKVTETKIDINGNNNIIGNGNVHIGGDVNLSPQVTNKTVVKTGDGVVDAEQKAELQRLIYDWVDSRNAVKKRSMSRPAAWKAFNATFGINSYHELPMEQFGEGRLWIMKQIGIISSMKSAPKKMPGWRTRTITYIKAACKNDLNNPDAYKPYIEQKFCCNSLAKCKDDELQAVKQYVANLKKKAR